MTGATHHLQSSARMMTTTTTTTTGRRLVASPEHDRHRRYRRRANARPRRHLRATTARDEEDPVEVVIVGAGIAGLTCASELQKRGVSFALVEAEDDYGGRVRTDFVDGFTLDRGFQIFLTAYPKARELLDYDALRLKEFYAGASVRYGGEFHRVADPLRHPVDGVLSLANPIGSVQDKVLIGLYRFQAFLKSLDAILASEEETSIASHLRAVGFSDDVIGRFFRPFLGGIFFDRDLGTTSRLFEFVMKMLATGSNCFPEGGIGEVSKQLGRGLPEAAVHLGERIETIGRGEDGFSVVSHSGREFRGRYVVVAADAPSASAILSASGLLGRDGTGIRFPEMETSREPVGTVCLYYRTEMKPESDLPMLYLNGEDDASAGATIVNNCCFPSTVSPSYAPPGQTLVSVSLIGNFESDEDEALAERVRREMKPWFGAAFVDSWDFMRAYRIRYAQPNQAPPTDFAKPVGGFGGAAKGVFVCGDHRDGATLDGALRSGQRAAMAVVEERKRGGERVAAVSNAQAAG